MKNIKDFINSKKIQVSYAIPRVVPLKDYPYSRASLIEAAEREIVKRLAVSILHKENIIEIEASPNSAHEILKTEVYCFTTDELKEMFVEEYQKEEILKVGKITISRFDENSFWMQHEDGGGMQLTEEFLTKLWMKGFSNE